LVEIKIAKSPQNVLVLTPKPSGVLDKVEVVAAR